MRLDTGTAKDNEHAMKCFSEAIRSNPRHARAHAGLALAWWERSGVFLMPADAMEKARRSALDALALDATLPEAHIALALVLYRYDWNWTGALAHLEEARSLAPDSFRAQQEYGRYLMLRGQFDEAAKVLAQAQRLDLFLLGNLDVDLGECSYFAGDHAAAIKHTSRVIESKPSRRKAQRFKAYWIRGEARAKLGRLKDAAQDLEMACDIEPDQTELLAGLCHIYVAAGKREKAEEIFKDLLGQGTGGRYVSHVALAVASAALGDRGRAFDILRGDAVASRDEWLVYLKVDPIFRDVGLAQDGRFQELLLQVGL
jgi:tetratricopeptide (TPR) repeat protein